MLMQVGTIRCSVALGMALSCLAGCGRAIDASDQGKSSARPLRAANITVDRLAISAFQPGAGATKIDEVPADRELDGLPGAHAYHLSSATLPTTYLLEAGIKNGATPPLVLIHGLGEAGARDFYPVLQALSTARRVLAIELPGIARSELGSAEPDPLVFAERVNQVIAARVDGPFDLLGHSLGGAVALLVEASQRKNVRRLVLVDVAGILNQDAFAGSQIEWLTRDVASTSAGSARVLNLLGKKAVVVSQWFRPSDDSISWGAQRLSGIQARAALALIQTNMGAALRGSAQPSIATPTLIVWGTSDSVAPLRTAELLSSRIANSELRILDGVGHVPMVEAPAHFSAYVNEFLLRNDASGETAAKSNLAALGVVHSAKSGSCVSQDELVFSGVFSTLTIENCEEILLDRVTVERLVIRESEVDISRSVITAGITAIDSEIRLTGGRVSGQVALSLEASEADVAGSLLEGTHASVQSTGESDFLGSSVLTDGPRGRGSVHGHVVLQDGEGF